MKTFSLFGLAFLALSFLACGFGSKGSAPIASVTPAAPEVAAKKVYTRDEFKALVVGKSQDEVMKLLGRPSRTSEAFLNNEKESWVYEKIVLDPISQKIDSTVYVYFSQDKICTRVSH